MLHILLGLLKIIGILIAVILGLVLLVVLIVFFAALRYETSVVTDGDIKKANAKVKFSWLYHLISGYFIYQNEQLDWQVKILWKKLNVPEKEKKEDKPKKQAKKVEVEPVQVESVQEEVVAAPVEEKTEKTIVSDNTKSEKISSQAKNPEVDLNKKKKKKKQKNKKKKKSTNLRCSIQKISDKIKELIEMKDKVVAFIEAEEHKNAFKKLLQELLRLLKNLKPKKLKGNVEFGFDDPSKTGSALAYLSILYPFYGDNVSITPHFDDAMLKGDIYIKGRLRIVYIVNMGIRLILNKNIRLTIKDVMKIVAKN